MQFSKWHTCIALNPLTFPDSILLNLFVCSNNQEVLIYDRLINNTLAIMWVLNGLYKKTLGIAQYLLQPKSSYSSLEHVIHIKPKYANKPTLMGFNIDLGLVSLTSSFLKGTRWNTMKLNECYAQFWLKRDGLLKACGPQLDLS